MKKETVDEKDLFYILDILDNSGVKYYLDGGWGVDALTGKQNRKHRDSVLEVVFAKNPNFDDLDALSSQIESAALTAIEEIMPYLS